MGMELSDHITIATLFALIMGIVKGFDYLMEYISKRAKKDKNGHEDKPVVMVVQLDPEVSRLIHDTQLNTQTIKDIVLVRDLNGAPMVYGPREELRLVAAAVDRIEDKVQDKKK